MDDGFIANLTFVDGKTAVVDVGTSNLIALPKWYVTGSSGAIIIEDWEMNGKLVQLTKDARVMCLLLKREQD